MNNNFDWADIAGTSHYNLNSQHQNAVRPAEELKESGLVPSVSVFVAPFITRRSLGLKAHRWPFKLPVCASSLGTKKKRKKSQCKCRIGDCPKCGEEAADVAQGEGRWERWQVQGGRGSGLWEVTSSSRVGREPVGNRPRSLGRILQILKVCC